MSVATSEIQLTRTNAGVLRIGKTRVSLDSVIIAFNQGSTPEEIVCDYDSLTLPDVYATVSYYLQNREKTEAYLLDWLNFSRQMREKQAENPPPVVLRLRKLKAEKSLLTV